MNLDKFIPCRKCKANGQIPDGYIKTEQGVRECDCHKKWQLSKTVFIKYKQNGFNPLDFDKTFDDYVGKKSLPNITRIKGYLDCFDSAETKDKVKSSVLYLYGPNGTQKTTIAAVIGKTLLFKGVSTRYILMKQLIDALWNSQRDAKAKDLIDRLIECDVLIIDESFSKDKLHLWASGNQLGYIDEFIRERINSAKGIIFISNTRSDQIEEQGFSHSIQDLVLRETAKQKAVMTFEDNYMDSIGDIPTQLF